MSPNGNGFPKPEPALIVIGMVIWAIAVALGPQRRARFIEALAEQVESEEGRRRVVSITTANATTNGGRRALTQAVNFSARFVGRIVAELRAAR